MIVKGLTEHQAWKLIDFMFGYTGDEEWEQEMIAALTEPELDETMELIVTRYKAARKEKYRAKISRHDAPQ